MNIDELQRKADKLVETLKEAKSLINDLATGKEIIDLTLDGKEIASSTCSKNDRWIDLQWLFLIRHQRQDDIFS